MIVWITHVKVGHRQTPYKQKPSGENLGVFAFLGVLLDEVATTTDNSLFQFRHQWPDFARSWLRYRVLSWRVGGAVGYHCQVRCIYPS